jgi:hypothetical protein
MGDQSSHNNPDISQGAADLDDGLGAMVNITPTQDEVDLQSRALAQAQNQRIVLPEGATKGIAVEYLTKTVLKNEYGLPDYFYRSDMLPHDLRSLMMDDTEAAIVSLDYSEGYPTYDGGKIFWQQLPHEPYEAFCLFQRYLGQAEEVGIRQLQLFSMEENISLSRARELSLEYLWNVRARAFDLFQVAAERKKRELRARKTETTHFEKAGELLEAIMRKFQDPDWIEGLSPKEALAALTDLIKIQRVSVGLSANGNAGPGAIDPNSGATAEVIMRSITKSVVEDDGSMTLTPDLEALMSDPNFSMKAQELIFRVRKGYHTVDNDISGISSEKF